MYHDLFMFGNGHKTRRGSDIVTIIKHANYCCEKQCDVCDSNICVCKIQMHNITRYREQELVIMNVGLSKTCLALIMCLFDSNFPCKISLACTNHVLRAAPEKVSPAKRRWLWADVAMEAHSRMAVYETSCVKVRGPPGVEANVRPRTRAVFSTRCK